VAYRCFVCGKSAMSGHTVSHAHNLSKRKWNPNLQRVRASVEGHVKNVNVCTRCLRSGKVQKAVRGRSWTKPAAA
jgi:large subunit ribosomal protein L28